MRQNRLDYMRVVLDAQLIGDGQEKRILLKLKFFNPLSSVKDRIGVSTIDAR